MKKTIKRILSLVLTVLMLVGAVPMSFAKDADPVIVVSGMASYTLDDGETGERVYGPKTEVILSLVGRALPDAAKFLFTKDYQALADAVVSDVYNSIFEGMACDAEGNSKHNITTKTFPLSLDNYPDEWDFSTRLADEEAVIGAAIKTVGADNSYFFNYDWRLDPMATAEKLNAFIENVKQVEGSSTVTLIPCSMGGVITNAYLSKYGNASVSRIVYAMTAYHGMDMVGELFNKNLTLDTKLLTEYLFTFQRDKVDMQILMALLKTVTEMFPALSKGIDSFIDESLFELSDRVYNEILVGSLGSCPGFWSFIPDNYYESAKKAMFGEKLNAEFERKIDSYHYGVQVKAHELMENARLSGTDIILLSSYGFVGAPCTTTAYEQSDCLIETYHEAGGATTALWGKTLGDKNYEPIGTVCGDKSHNHVSTDLIIDASTGVYPEYTWYLKYNKHVGLDYDTDCTDFLQWLITAESQPTVHDNEKYPQFMHFNNTTGKLTSLTGDERKANILDGESNFFVRFFVILESLYSTIINWFESLKK